ncbi:MAG: SHOCT domain-containing protein [Jatrophihabitantaceae bacterium]
MLIAASDYPFLSIMWSMFIFFGWVLFIWLLIMVYSDLFRRKDMSGWLKGLWFVVTLIFPYIGVFVYLITQGNAMAERAAERAGSTQQQFARYNGHSDSAGQIEQAKHLLDTGAITQDEYTTLKTKALAL